LSRLGRVGTRLALDRCRSAVADTAEAAGSSETRAPRIVATGRRKEGVPMISLALTFLIVGLVAGILGLYGVAAMASQIAWVLFLIGVVFLIIHMIGSSRRLPPAV
jgi:uncharacterized membrane protein YtjA (UPF0391 family)